MGQPEAGKRRGAMGGQGWSWVGRAGSTCRHFCEPPASRPGGETRRHCNTCPETGWYHIIIFEISDEFLLLGIHGDDGLADALKSSNLLVDVAKLPVPVGMTLSFFHRLAIRL